MPHISRKGLKFGDFVELKRPSHDGYLWVTAQVVWLGQLSMRLQVGSTTPVSVAYSAEAEVWRRVA